MKQRKVETTVFIKLKLREYEKFVILNVNHVSAIEESDEYPDSSVVYAANGYLYLVDHTQDEVVGMMRRVKL